MTRIGGILVGLFLTIVVGCKKSNDEIKVTKESVHAGTSISFMGEKVLLYGGKLELEQNLLASLNSEIADKIRGRVAVVSVIPSLETKVCDIQTHQLGESNTLKKEVARVTISRDLPFTQERFAKQNSLENIVYYSDYKNGNFGRTTGLMMMEKEILARAVIVVDKEGIIRHLQIVPEVVELPDMNAAFEVANKLVE